MACSFQSTSSMIISDYTDYRKLEGKTKYQVKGMKHKHKNHG